jgi:hypothetical protein
MSKTVPHPATLAPRAAPHPATVVQRWKPHPATVVQRATPHAAAPPRPANHGQSRAASRAVLVQAASQDRYEKQNELAASALQKASGGGGAITLLQLKSSEMQKKVEKSRINNTLMAIALINDLNAQLGAAAPAPTAAAGYQTIVEYIGEQDRYLQLREPHVGRANPAQPSTFLANDLGDMDLLAAAGGTVVQLAWHYYAQNTPSHGYAKLTGQARPHTPQWAELGSSGVTSRIIYDYWNDVFYLTPHYNAVPQKGLINPYITLTGAPAWTFTDLLT